MEVVEFIIEIIIYGILALIFMWACGAFDDERC